MFLGTESSSKCPFIFYLVFEGQREAKWGGPLDNMLCGALSQMLSWVENEFLHVSVDTSITELRVKAARAVAMAWSAQWSALRMLAAVSFTSLWKHTVSITLFSPASSLEHDRSLWVWCSLCTNDLAHALLLLLAQQWLHCKVLSLVQIFQMCLCLINYKSRQAFTVHASLAVTAVSALVSTMGSERTLIIVWKQMDCNVLYKCNCSEQIHISCLWFSVWQLHKS